MYEAHDFVCTDWSALNYRRDEFNGDYSVNSL